MNIRMGKFCLVVGEKNPMPGEIFRDWRLQRSVQISPLSTTSSSQLEELVKLIITIVIFSCIANCAVKSRPGLAKITSVDN